VRHALAATLAQHPDLGDDDFVSARQLNLETIHRHDVVAERSGTVGELRRELQGTVAGRHTELRDWLSAS
jgi:GTP cyclohydrolase IV